MDIIIFAAGKRCIALLQVIKHYNLSNINVCAVLDSDNSKVGSCVEGYLIQNINELINQKDCYVCITIADNVEYNRIKEKLAFEFGINKYVDYDELILSGYRSYLSRHKSIDESRMLTPMVLFDCFNGLGLGGIEEWTKKLCRDLSAYGFDNYRIVVRNEKLIHDFELFENLYTLCPDGVPDIHSYCPNIFGKLIDYITSHSYCICITSQPTFFFQAAVLSKEFYPTKISIVSVIHADLEETYVKNIEKEKYIDFFVCVSEKIRDELIKRGVNKRKCLVITAPVEMDDNAYGCRTYTLSKNKPLQLGYAGRLEILQKRMDLLVRTVEKLSQSNVNFHINIAGDGSAKEMMHNYFCEYNLLERVSFVGTIDRKDIHNFWCKQDIYMSVSDLEGHSISQLEAMLYGAVPVCTEVSGTDEDIEDDISGYLVRIGDGEGVAKKIQYIDENRELLPIIGRNAHNAVYDKTRTEKHVAFWINTIQSLIDELESDKENK